MSELFYSKWSEEAKCAYAAGAMDSDGSIGFAKQAKQIQIQFAQTIKGIVIVDFMKKEFYARVGKRPNEIRRGDRQDMIMGFWRKPPEVMAVLSRIRPYLIFKIDQADLAIEYTKFILSRKGIWTNSQKAYAHEVASKFSFLNRKGKLKNQQTFMRETKLAPSLFDIESESQPLTCYQ